MSTPPSPRIDREQRTVAAMVAIYCRGRHGTTARAGLCDDCRGLLAYATCRLERCPFGEFKTPCVDCAVHCYKADRREQVRAVMRYAGPRMLWRHPILAVRHLRDGRRRPPVG
jgi:predicted amidophosphoribosyltransferase